MALAPEFLASSFPAGLRTRTIVVGVLGCGVVGGGVVARILEDARISHSPLRLGRVLVRDLTKPRFPESVAEFLTTDPSDVVDDPEVDVVIETLGGTDVAREYIERALRRGKHVISANKALVASAGARLAHIARDHHAAFRFEAAVGGAIPIVRAVSDALAAEPVSEVSGIVNGTSNYIMRAMGEGKDFAGALHEAQVAGYAEPDPTNDVDGIDAAQKLAVLAPLAFRRSLAYEKIARTSLRRLDPADFALAERLGCRLVPLSLLRRRGDALEGFVSPTYVPRDHEFARPVGPGNVIRVVGDESGPLHFSGQGAGRRATASAVFGDLAEIVRKLERWEHQASTVWDVASSSVVAPFCDYIVRVAHNESSRVGEALDTYGLSLEVVATDALVLHNVQADKVEAILRRANLTSDVCSLFPRYMK